MLVHARAADVRARHRARQRKGRLGQIDHRDARRGRADEGRAAGRDHRSRLPPEELHPLHRKPPRLGGARRPRPEDAGRITASRAARRCGSTRTRRSSSPASPRRSPSVEQTHDFIVVDTPGTDSYLMRLAHSMADTLITPLNDSFVDFDVLGTVDPTTFAVTGESHYAEMVRDARRQRRLVDGAQMDWIVVRNRLSMLGSRNKRLVGEGLERARRAARLPLRRRLRRARGLSRVLPARADRARQARRGDARHAAEHVARDRARGGHGADRGAQAAARRARPAPRRGPRRMVLGARTSRSRCTTSSRLSAAGRPTRPLRRPPDMRHFRAGRTCRPRALLRWPTRPRDVTPAASRGTRAGDDVVARARSTRSWRR